MKNFPIRNCALCSSGYRPTGPAARYCDPCAKTQREIAAQRGREQYQRKKLGDRYGIGTGGGQPTGKDHPTYKNGIGAFHQFSKTARQTVRYCQRCSADLLNATRGQYAVHHRDHNRDNNDLSNWELLCKRCHQLEHQCWENLPRSLEGLLRPQSCEVCHQQYQPTGPAARYCSTCRDIRRKEAQRRYFDRLKAA